MFGQKVVPSREGGIEVVIGELASRMAALGNDVTLLNRMRKHGKDNPKTKEYKGCHLKEIFTINRKSLDAIVYAFFATLKSKFGHYDVIHVHAEGPCNFLWILGKHKHTKLVVTIHGLDWMREKWGGIATKIILNGEKQAVKHADEIIVLSENVKKYFKDKYNRDTVFIPNGVAQPEPHVPDMIFKKWNLTKDSYVLFLARIVPEKGLHYLIEAWRQLSEKDKHGKKLVIAGSSSHSNDYLVKIINMCKGDGSIVMTGFVEGQILKELYTNAYLYVLPSDIEGMPMSLLEAISYGDSCLVSDIPENKNLIGENSNTFKAGNIKDLAIKMDNLLSFKKNNNSNRKTFFDWDYVTSKTLLLYKNGEGK